MTRHADRAAGRPGGRPPGARTGHVRLTIDDRVVDAPKGELIIRTCERLGIIVPRFCDHPAARSGGRVPPVPGRGRDGRAADAQAAGQLHDDGGRRHGRAHPAHLEGGRQGAAGRHGAAADQPPAGLPDLRQGRRVPAAEPGDDQRAAVLAVPRPQAHVRQADRDVHRGASRPRALHLLPALHPLLRADRRATRSSSFFERGPAQFIDVAEDKPFQSYFSGNTIQICPVGALTSTAYRFRSRPFDLVSTPSVCEHCAAGCAQRSDTRRGVVMRRMAGNDAEVNEEWICDKGRFAFRYITSRGPDHPADGPPARWHAGRDVVDRRAVGRRARAPRRARGRHRRARGRSAHRRGRLRLRQVRAGRGGHQRRRLPRPPAVGARSWSSSRRTSSARARRSSTTRASRPRPPCSAWRWSRRRRRRSSTCACARRCASTASTSTTSGSGPRPPWSAHRRSPGRRRPPPRTTSSRPCPARRPRCSATCRRPSSSGWPTAG